MAFALRRVDRFFGFGFGFGFSFDAAGVDAVLLSGVLGTEAEDDDPGSEEGRDEDDVDERDLEGPDEGAFSSLTEESDEDDVDGVSERLAVAAANPLNTGGLISDGLSE